MGMNMMSEINLKTELKNLKGRGQPVVSLKS